MAQIEEGGGRRSTNVELNLVPFIDLMCVCITFLLITAVWTQISMIQLGTSIYGKKTQEAVEPQKKTSDVAFRLDVRDHGFVLNIGLQVIKIPKLDGRYDQLTLNEELGKIRKAHPEKKDVVVSVEDELPYDMMIQAMDHLIAGGFVDIGIATGAVR